MQWLLRYKRGAKIDARRAVHTKTKSFLTNLLPLASNFSTNFYIMDRPNTPDKSPRRVEYDTPKKIVFLPTMM